MTHTPRYSDKLLVNEPPLQVLPTLAQIIGLNEAIILQQIHYWQDPRFNVGRDVDGVKWIRNSYRDWQASNFPFWSHMTIKRSCDKLVSLGILIQRDDLNSRAYDKTTWVTLDYNTLDEVAAAGMQALRSKAAKKAAKKAKKATPPTAAPAIQNNTRQSAAAAPEPRQDAPQSDEDGDAIPMPPPIPPLPTNEETQDNESDPLPPEDQELSTARNKMLQPVTDCYSKTDQPSQNVTAPTPVARNKMLRLSTEKEKEEKEVRENNKEDTRAGIIIFSEADFKILQETLKGSMTKAQWETMIRPAKFDSLRPREDAAPVLVINVSGDLMADRINQQLIKVIQPVLDYQAGGHVQLYARDTPLAKQPATATNRPQPIQAGKPAYRRDNAAAAGGWSL